MHFETKGEKELNMQEMKKWKLQYTEHFEFALSKPGETSVWISHPPQEIARERQSLILLISSVVMFLLNKTLILPGTRE